MAVGARTCQAKRSRKKSARKAAILAAKLSEAMNKVGDPKALRAVLGFEIDRNDGLWILDRGHIAGKPSEPGAEKLVL